MKFLFAEDFGEICFYIENKNCKNWESDDVFVCTFRLHALPDSTFGSSAFDLHMSKVQLLVYKYIHLSEHFQSCFYVINGFRHFALDVGPAIIQILLASACVDWAMTASRAAVARISRETFYYPYGKDMGNSRYYVISARVARYTNVDNCPSGFIKCSTASRRELQRSLHLYRDKKKKKKTVLRLVCIFGLYGSVWSHAR